MIDRIKRIFKPDDLKAKFAKGGILLTGGMAFENVARFVRNIILTRIIAPEYFGLMATILAVISTFQAFTEVGVRQAVIHEKSGSTKEYLNVAWWLSAARGFVLFLVAFFAAPFICDFYETNELLLPLRAASFVLIFNGIVSPRIHVLEKELNYKKWIIIRQSSAFLGVSISIVASLFYQNIWPLVMGFGIEFLFIFISSYIFIPFKPTLNIDKDSLRSLIRFAKGMFGLPILTAIFQRIDIFAIGKLLSMTDLGLYSIAQSFAYAPNFVFAKIVRPLVLPALARIQDDKAALRNIIEKITKYVALFTLPLIAYFIVFAKPLLTLLYGVQYGAVYGPFSILMLYVAIMFYSSIIMQLYFALGKPGLHRNFAFIRMVIGALLIYPLTVKYELYGAAFTIFISMTVLFVMQIIWTQKLISLTPLVFFRNILPGILSSVIVLGPGIGFKNFVNSNETTSTLFGLGLCFVSWMFTAKILLSKEFNINIFSGRESLVNTKE